MRRFLVSKDQLDLNTVLLAGDEFHHLKNVCRLDVGERVELLDGNGQLALAKILRIGKSDADLEIESKRKLPPIPNPKIKVFLGVSKFQTMDSIIEKLSEVGVDEVVPLLSERTFVRRSSPDLIKKIGKWKKIADLSCKQCGRGWPLKISDPVNLMDAIKTLDSKKDLLFYEGDGDSDFSAQLKVALNSPQLAVVVGSEGGFSSSEIELFKGRGLSPISLGDLVLRVETACISVASIIQYELNKMRKV